MRRLSLLLIAFAFVTWCGPARATPPAQALYGTIKGQTVAIFEQNSAMGECLMGEVQQGANWVSVFSIQCEANLEGAIAQHGDARGYITWLLPDVNIRLNSFFNGGSNGEAAIDEALNTSFAISGGQLVPK